MKKALKLKIKAAKVEGLSRAGTELWDFSSSLLTRNIVCGLTAAVHTDQLYLESFDSLLSSRGGHDALLDAGD